MTSATEIEFRTALFDDGPGAALVQAMREEMATIYDGLDVVPSERGRGVARQLLGALERTAAELGYTVARLVTGPRQPAAQHLYESAGYQAIGNLNDDPAASFFAEKRLR